MEKTISMKCSICGNDQFNAVDQSVEDINTLEDYMEVKCSDCGHICTKEQLIEDNGHIIDANIEDMADDLVNELQKKMDKMFK